MPVKQIVPFPLPVEVTQDTEQAKITVDYKESVKEPVLKQKQASNYVVKKNKKEPKIEYNYQGDPDIKDKHLIKSKSDIRRNAGLYTNRLAEKETPTRKVKAAFFNHVMDNWVDLQKNEIVRCDPKEAKDWYSHRNDEIFNVRYSNSSSKSKNQAVPSLVKSKDESKKTS